MRQLISGELTEEQAKLLDKNTLEKIVSLPVFGETKGYKTYREQAFEAFFNADEIGYEGTKTEVLVQKIYCRQNLISYSPHKDVAIFA